MNEKDNKKVDNKDEKITYIPKCDIDMLTLDKYEAFMLDSEQGGYDND